MGKRKRQAKKSKRARRANVPIATKSEYRGLSSRVKALLMMQEGTNLEFKETIASVLPELLVAIANSGSSGTILVGVEEKKRPTGRQSAKIVGCGVGDAEKLKILQKANDCSPPIHIEIATENLNSVPFLRIEVLSSSDRPHCTKKGVYKIRKGARNNPLPPNQLLQIFLSTESAEFVNRFREAASGIKSDLSSVREEIDKSMDHLRGNLARMDREITLALEDIFGEANSANSLAEESYSEAEASAGTVWEIKQLVEHLIPTMADMHRAVDQLAYDQRHEVTAQDEHRGAVELNIDRLSTQSQDLRDKLEYLIEGIEQALGRQPR